MCGVSGMYVVCVVYEFVRQCVCGMSMVCECICSVCYVACVCGVYVRCVCECVCSRRQLWELVFSF